MPRILALDYGLKRTGLAWTDPMQIIATGLTTVPTEQLEARLQALFQQEDIEALVLGYPTRNDGSDTHATAAVRTLKEQLEKAHPDLKIHLWDERFTSKLAVQALLDSGASKKKRREKGLVDQVSATIILQEFLDQR
jgi:putative holliday junction resolvase